LGFNLKLGIGLAKRQVCVLRLGWCYKFGIMLAKPVVCGERKLHGWYVGWVLLQFEGVLVMAYIILYELVL